MLEIIGFLGLFLVSNENNELDISKINQTKNLVNYKTISNDLVYQEKQFNLSWQMINNSITKTPVGLKNKLKIICKNHNKSVLVKIKSYADDKVVGTFDCRL
tara:strand:- start:745 stop:1050 length:306 start_codon:yes stop_codon:yes gene_type:complete